MGELAGSLAHELNQPLAAILSNAQAAQRFLGALIVEILDDIVQDNCRAVDVIRKMRALVKKEKARLCARRSEGADRRRRSPRSQQLRDAQCPDCGRRR